MIPNLDKPKYKPLVRLRADVWNTLHKKTFKRKKWRPIISFFKRNRKSRKIYTLLNYQSKNLSRFPVYRKYNYQKELFLRQHIKLIYGRLQDFKIKKISRQSQKSWLNFAQKLEQKTITILYRLQLVNTYGEAKLHQSHKRILVNGSYIQKQIQKGDILHFSPDYEKVLRKRIYKNYLNIKKFKYSLNQEIDFDVNSLRFFFLKDLYYFKNHPFKLPYERVIRWYNRV